MEEKKLILGIETSCDDTSVALVSQNFCSSPFVDMLSFSQEEILSRWGGVVPELASRNHAKKLPLLLKTLLKKNNVSLKDIGYIGITTHPGLLGPLLTGLNGAKTLSLLHQIPIVPVNHLYAHMEAIHLTEEVPYPYLGLLVSGGHTLLILVCSSTEFHVLGSTLDDAAGEAFDKGGKLLGLSYPAGKKIDELAKKGNPHRFSFPIPLKNTGHLHFSFSGLKNAIRLFALENEKNIKHSPDFLRDTCASYQHAICTSLLLKLKKAHKLISQETDQTLPIVIGGGVACNSYLRSELKKWNKDIHFVAPQFCTDNGAMVANYALRTLRKAIPFPRCLSLDVKSRFVNNSSLMTSLSTKSTPDLKKILNHLES